MTRDPIEVPVSEADTALAATTARLLGAGARSLGAGGLACAALAGAALLLHPSLGAASRALLVGVRMLAPLERVLTLRLLFDAGLFADLARPASADPLPALDLALQTLRLRAPSAAPRPLAERANGACRLLFWQGSCVLLQFGTLAGAVFSLLPGSR